MRRLASALILGLWFIGETAFAEEPNQIPSCYAANGLDRRLATPVRDIVVMIDQTTMLDDSLKRSVMRIADELFVPGLSFTIIRFSAFAQGRYTSVVARGILEPPLPQNERNATGVTILKRFNACMEGQRGFGRRIAATAIAEALAGASADLSKSDIFSAIREASFIPRQSPAKDRLILLVSDMLENSAVSTFYAKNAIRAINPAEELRKVEKAGLMSDCGGARVYVIGAGFVVADKSDKKSAYRDPKTMKSLADFWARYFAASKATLSGFGQPELLIPIR